MLYLSSSTLLSVAAVTTCPTLKVGVVVEDSLIFAPVLSRDLILPSLAILLISALKVLSYLSLRCNWSSPPDLPSVAVFVNVLGEPNFPRQSLARLVDGSAPDSAPDNESTLATLKNRFPVRSTDVRSRQMQRRKCGNGELYTADRQPTGERDE
ncbi:hypothetical protein F5Y12DRAFT_727280 [Xylaria sp. FL1777]|nr:hypothetical protein F5Y12DRAFT_727280 [Xylaria sp. FL1777]